MAASAASAVATAPALLALGLVAVAKRRQGRWTGGDGKVVKLEYKELEDLQLSQDGVLTCLHSEILCSVDFTGSQ